MSGFSADWLALREPFDTVARGRAWSVLDLPDWSARVRQAQGPDAEGQAVEIVDLACGSGANLRALAPRIGGAQRWRLIDHDPALLAAVPRAIAAWAQQHGYRFTDSAGTQPLGIEGPGFQADVTSERIDLARHLDRLDFTRTDLVTGSALLDLVSADWLRALLARAYQAGSTLLFALNVDGRTAWQPGDADDDAVHALFSQHQLRDKGFGPALGAHVADAARPHLITANYTVRQAASDWLIDGASDPGMVAAMVEGMANAACEQSPAAKPMVRAWKSRRLASVASSRLVVGHVELMALPATATGPSPTTGPGPSAPR
jgi:SAM-dependent methyltransferase